MCTPDRSRSARPLERAKYRPNTHISYLTRGPSGCSICASSIAAVSSCCSSNRRADKGAGYAKCRQYTPNHLCVNPSVRLGDLFNTDAVNSLSSEPSGPAHAPARSGRQSSVSTNNHPGESENVRLLLHRNHGFRVRYVSPLTTFYVTTDGTDLTSPLPSSETPLQPSRPRVHGLRSMGLRLTLLHPRPVCALSLSIDELELPPVQRSFSHSSTSRISDDQCLSSSRSIAEH